MEFPFQISLKNIPCSVIFVTCAQVMRLIFLGNGYPCDKPGKTQAAMEAYKDIEKPPITNWILDTFFSYSNNPCLIISSPLKFISVLIF
jgi:hypothetical protein